MHLFSAQVPSICLKSFSKKYKINQRNIHNFPSTITWNVQSHTQKVNLQMKVKMYFYSLICGSIDISAFAIFLTKWPPSGIHILVCVSVDAFAMFLSVFPLTIVCFVLFIVVHLSDAVLLVEIEITFVFISRLLFWSLVWVDTLTDAVLF